MARRPVDLQQKLPQAAGYERWWQLIREARRFTVKDIEGRCGGYTRRDTLRQYIKGLEKAGYLRVAETTGNNAKVYELVRDVGVEAPRVKRDGTKVTQGMARDQMWRAMKMLGEFSAHDLAVTASTEEHPVQAEDAISYTRYLHRAGYLAVTTPGGPGRPVRYRFIKSRNTGARPPQVQRVRQVFDPNLGEVVWTSGGGA